MALKSYLGDGSNVANYAAQVSGRTGDSVQDQYATGWWSRITGGATEKASAIAMSNVDRAFQAEQARINREFQERLSSSAYQRAVEDMKKAGLNPALMYKGLDASSTPTGYSPQGSRTTPPASSTGQLVSLIASAIFAGAKLATSASVAGAKSTAYLSTAKKLAAMPKPTPAQVRSLDALYRNIR